MAKSIEQILGWLNLTGEIKVTTTGIPNPLPKPFFSTTKPTDADKGVYTTTRGQRKLARSVKYGARPSLRELLGVGEKPVKLIHNIEEQEIDPLIMRHLRAKDAFTRDLAESEIKRQVAEFKQLFVNTQIASIISMLSLTTANKIHVDANGYILPTSSGAADSYEFQVAATHQNQLNGIIAASWATTTTDIPLHLRNLRKQSLKDTGRRLGLALYGENVPTYLAANNFMKDWWVRNPGYQMQWLNGWEIPDGMLGFRWIPMYGSFFEDNSGTNQDLWGADHITFLPAVSGNQPSDSEENAMGEVTAMSDWYEMMLGTYEVPRSLSVAGDAASVLSNVETVLGMFSYGTIDKYAKASTVAGQTFLPVLKNPDVLYAADVTP